MSPIHDILGILGLAIDAGIILLMIGYILGIISHARYRDWGHMLFGHNGVVALLFYICFLGLLALWAIRRLRHRLPWRSVIGRCRSLSWPWCLGS